jgi:hypothetical protein
VVISLATLLIGGFLGYAIGRPNTSPPLHGGLEPGQVRVPDLRDLDATDTRAILGPLDLQTGAIGFRLNQAAPKGIVLEQDPPGGTAVPTGTTIDLVASSGPGPGAAPEFEFGRSILLPLTHVGTYAWTSDPIALDGPAVSLGASTRVIGHAGVTPYRITRAPAGPGLTAVTVGVDVASFEPPAWFVIERAYVRTQDVPTLETSMTATPTSGPAGTSVTIEGFHCQGTPAGTTVAVTAEFSRGGAKPYAVVPLPVRGAAYAFRMTFTVPGIALAATGSNEVHPGDEIVFVTSGGACRTAPFRVT